MKIIVILIPTKPVEKIAMISADREWILLLNFRKYNAKNTKNMRTDHSAVLTFSNHEYTEATNGESEEFIYNKL